MAATCPFLKWDSEKEEPWYMLPAVDVTVDCNRVVVFCFSARVI